MIFIVFLLWLIFIVGGKTGKWRIVIMAVGR